MRHLLSVCTIGTVLLNVCVLSAQGMDLPAGQSLSIMPQISGNLVGPVYPPPLGVDWSGSGNSGTAGGATWIYQNVLLADYDTVYWGPVNDEIGVSFNDSVYSAREILRYDPGSSNPGSGILVWEGSTFFPGGTDTVFTRYTMQIKNYATGGVLSLLAAGQAGLPDNVGGVLWVTTGLEYSVNFIFEAAFSREGLYEPALAFFDTHKPAGAIPYLSFLAGFYYINSPPQLTANNPLPIDEGQIATITTEFLAAGDVESGSDQIYFTIAPGDLGGAPHFGWLRLNEDTLHAGDTFSLSDIENYRVTYVHGGGENTLDNFTYNITDGDGGSAPTGEFLTYTFAMLINPINDPPVALPGAAKARVSTPLDGYFSAADVDSPAQKLQFSLVADGNKGSTIILNDSTGLFRYTPDAGALGKDTITFQVYDGYAYSDENGNMVITIETVPVLPQGHILIGKADPARILMIDPVSGQPSVYCDLFPLSTNKDLRTNDIVLDPQGNLYATTNDTGLIKVDYLTGQVAVIMPADSFAQPLSIDLSAQGELFVCDAERGIIRVDPQTGQSARLPTGDLLQFPVGITAAPDGYLYVTDAGKLDSTDGRLYRIDPADGNHWEIGSGPNLSDPAYLINLPGDRVCISDFDGFGGSGHILTVGLSDGKQEVIASGEHLTDPMGIGIFGSLLYVSNLSGGTIIEVDMDNSGSQRIAFSDTTITDLFGIYVIPETISGLPAGRSTTAPETFVLEQNFPNPFNPVTTIRYFLPVSAQVCLEVFDITGRKVATLINTHQKTGAHDVTFDTAGRASGVYIYRMLVNGRVAAQRKMVVLK